MDTSTMLLLTGTKSKLLCVKNTWIAQDCCVSVRLVSTSLSCQPCWVHRTTSRKALGPGTGLGPQPWGELMWAGSTTAPFKCTQWRASITQLFTLLSNNSNKGGTCLCQRKTEPFSLLSQKTLPNICPTVFCGDCESELFRGSALVWGIK